MMEDKDVTTKKPSRGAPKPQTMPSTARSKAEAKTARPTKGRNINTPRTAVPPEPLERKRSPKSLFL